MSFRRRDYPEVLDSILTTLVGGVSAEAHPFPPPGDATTPRHLLDAPPARVIVSVFGERNGQSTRFKIDGDVELSRDGTAMVWRKGGARPDPGTLVQINYLRRDDAAILTDLEVGGVARTIAAAFARETARLYAQLQAVYDAGFIDTATGGSLDKLVALLGVERVPADRASATLVFTRDPGAPGAITIPAGTRVIDAEVKVEYETVETVTISPAQTRISVAARDVEPANKPVGADVLTTLPVPISGIVSVTNPAPAEPAAAAETDAELRTRARNFLNGGERATLGALKTALARQGIQGDITEPADRPGVVVVNPVAGDLTPERREQLLSALEDARAAGVVIELAGAQPPEQVEIEIDLTTRADLMEADRAAAHEAVRAAIEAYFAALPIREDARVNPIVGLVLAVPGVEDVTIVSAGVRKSDGTAEDRLDPTAGIIALAGAPARLSELSISDAALPTKADLRISFPASAAAPDRNAITAAVEAAFTYLATQAAIPAAADVLALSFGKLLRVLPAPVGQGQALPAYDTAPAPKPALPTGSGDYAVTLFIAQANGLTRILSSAADVYDLSPRERLILNSVTVEAEG